MTQNPVASTPGELLGTAVRIAREAAATARRMRAEAITDVRTKSTDTDVVTAADRAVERQVVDGLRRDRPGDSVLGEEYGDSAAPAGNTAAQRPGFSAPSVGPGAGGSTAAQRPGFSVPSVGPGAGSNTAAQRPGFSVPSVGPGAGSNRVRWILDPIDGTVNYLYDLPQWAVSLAAEVDGEVVAGVVHNGVTGAEWTATRGGGAWQGERRLTGSRRTTLDQSLVATGFGYAAARRAHQGRVLAGLITQVRDIRRFGAASLDLCLAAEGGVDAYFEKGLNLWDHAAGGLICREAGLVVSGIDGAPADHTMLIAAPPAIFPALHDALAKLDAAGGP